MFVQNVQNNLKVKLGIFVFQPKYLHDFTPFIKKRTSYF